MNAPASQDKESRPKRLAIVTTHPIQYQCPVWRALAARDDLEVKVFFGSDFSVRGYTDREFGTTVNWGGSLLEGFDSETLSHDELKSQWFGATHDILGPLRRYRPDACLLNAYAPLLYWNALRACRKLGIPVLLRAETTDVAQPRSQLKRFLRDAALRRFYSGVSCFLAIGTNSRRHYERLGISPSRIGFAPYCIDTDAFESQYAATRDSRSLLRRRLGIADEDIVVLFSGKLVPKKDPETLVRAIGMRDSFEGRRVRLLVVGDGTLRNELQSLADQVAPQRVHFLGFKQQCEMGELFAASDMLVLPSAFGETWGLVVNEAMQFGLPCIVSDRVGCGLDLIHNDKTGRVFCSGNIADLCYAIERVWEMLADNPSRTQAAVRAHVGAFSIGATAHGIAAASYSVQSRNHGNDASVS